MISVVRRPQPIDSRNVFWEDLWDLGELGRISTGYKGRDMGW